MLSKATNSYDSMVSLSLEQFTYKSYNSMIPLFLKGALFPLFFEYNRVSRNVGWVKIHIDDGSELLDQFDEFVCTVEAAGSVKRTTNIQKKES